MFSYWAYVLIGENNTGKTSFQRHVVNYLCNKQYSRLPVNTVKTIVHPRAPKCLDTIFTCNRSYQEKSATYKSVKNYFNNPKFFKYADICFLSSHTHGNAIHEIQEIQNELRSRYFNVACIFWGNSENNDTKKIALLRWDEVFWIENPILKNTKKVDLQIQNIAKEFADMLLARSHAQ